MPIKVTRSKFNYSNDILKIIVSFQNPPTYANSLLPPPAIDSIDSDGYITIPPMYFAVVDENNIVENNFDINTSSNAPDPRLLTRIYLVPETNSNLFLNGAEAGGQLFFNNGIASLPEQKIKYVGLGGSNSIRFKVESSDLLPGQSAIQTLSDFTISFTFTPPANTTTTTTIAGVSAVKAPVNSELLTLVLKDAGVSYDYRFLINKNTSPYIYSVARAVGLYSTNYYIPHWNKEKMGMSWKGSVHSAKYGNGLALVLENYDSKNEFGSPSVLIKRFDKQFLYLEDKFGSPDNEYQVVIRNRELTNSYIDSSSDNITKFLTSNSVINEKYNNIVSTNGRLYFVLENGGTFLIPTEDQFDASKIDYTFANFIPNFEAHKSSITHYNREPLEQKYGAIAGYYFNKDINDLSFGIMYVPDQSSVGIGNKTDCIFETYTTDIALIESDTKCPVLTPDGTGLITSNFVKIRDNFYDIKGAIAIFGGYEKYVVITPSNIYVFLSVSLSNTNFLVHTYNILHTSGISKWTDVTKNAYNSVLNYQSSDYDSQDIYISYISNCYELAEPAKFGTDIEEHKKSILLNGSPIDCVSLLKIPLDIFANTTNPDAFDAIGTSSIPLSNNSFEIINAGKTSNFPTINNSIDKVLYSSIPRSVLKTSDSSIPIFYRKAKNPKNSFGFVNPNSSVELYGNAVSTYRQYDKCCSQDIYTYKDVVTTPISETNQVSYVILGTPIINAEGKFVSIPVLDGGSGFVVAPSVLIVGGNGNGATATAIMENGSVTSILITNQGIGYSPSLKVVLNPNIAPSLAAVLGSPIVSSDGHIISIPVVSGGSGYSSASLSIVGGGGSGFIANAVVVNGVITSINITNQGNNYNPLPTIIAGVPFSKQAVAGTPVLSLEGNIISIPIIDSGDGYLSNPVISVVGAGSGATFVSNVVGGKLVSIKVENPGIGYLQPLTVTISAPDFSSASLGTAVFSSGSLVSVPIITGGTGYISNPTVLITGGGGSGATATATVVNGVVTGITITQAGSGYTSAPTVTVLNYNASSSLAYDPKTWKIKASINNIDFIKEVCLSKPNLNINFKLIDGISNSVVPLNGWFLLDFKGDGFTFNSINKSLAGEPVAVYMTNGVIDYSLDPRLFYTSSFSYVIIATDMLIYPANSNTSYSTGNYKFGQYSCAYKSGTTLTSPNTFSIDSNYLYFYDSVVNGTGRSSFAVIQSMITDKKGNFVVFKQGDLAKVNTYSIKNAERIGITDVYKFEIDQKNESFSLQNLDNCLVQLKNKPAFNQSIITTDINAIGTFAIKDPYSNLNVAPKLQETINIALNCENQNLRLPIGTTTTAAPRTELRIKYSVSNLFPSYFNPMLTYLSASSSVASNLWRGYSITGNEGDEVKFKYVESDPNYIFNALKKDDTGLFPSSFVGAPPLRNPIPEFTIVLPAAGIYEIEIELRSLISAGKFITDCFGPNNQTSLAYIYGKTVLVNIVDQFHTCLGENSTYKYKRAFQLYYDGKEIPRSKNRFPENEVSLVSASNINQAVQSVRYGYFPPIGYVPIDSIQQNSFHISRYTMPMSISLADDQYKVEGDPDYKVYITAKNQFYFNHEPSRYTINEKIKKIKVGDYITHPYIKLRYQGCNPDGTPGNGTSTIPPYNSLPAYQPLDNSFAKVVSVKENKHLDKFLGTSIVIDTEIDISNTNNVPLEFLFFTDSSIASLMLPNNSGFIDKTKDITLEEVGMPFTGEDAFKEDWCFFKKFTGSFGSFTPESVTWLNDKSKMATEIIFHTYVGSDAGIYSNPAIDYSAIKKANMKKSYCGNSFGTQSYEFSTWLDLEETKQLFAGKLRIGYCENMNYSGSPTGGWVFGGPADFGMNNFSSVLDQIGPGRKYKDLGEAWNGVRSDESSNPNLWNCDTWKEFKYPPLLPFRPASDKFYGYDLYPNTTAIPLKDFKSSSGVWSDYKCVQAIIAKHDPKFVCDNVSLTAAYPKLTISGKNFANCPFDAMITAVYQTPQSIKDAVANKLFKLSAIKSSWIMSDGVTKMAYCSTPSAPFDPNLIVAPSPSPSPTPTTDVISPSNCFAKWSLGQKTFAAWGEGSVGISNNDETRTGRFTIGQYIIYREPISISPWYDTPTAISFINKDNGIFGISFTDNVNSNKHSKLPRLNVGEYIQVGLEFGGYFGYYRIKEISNTLYPDFRITYILQCLNGTSTVVSQQKAVISNPAIASYSDTMFTITWTTDKPSTSRVVYGIYPVGDLASGADYDKVFPNDPRYGYQFSTVEDTKLTTSHSVTIIGLNPNRAYYFRAVSKASPTSVGGQITGKTSPQGSSTTVVSDSGSSSGYLTPAQVFLMLTRDQNNNCGINDSNVDYYAGPEGGFNQLFQLKPLPFSFYRDSNFIITPEAPLMYYRSNWKPGEPSVHFVKYQGVSDNYVSISLKYHYASGQYGGTAQEAMSKLNYVAPYETVRAGTKRLTYENDRNNKGVIFSYNRLSSKNSSNYQTFYWMLYSYSNFPDDTISYKFKCLGTSIPAERVTGKGAIFAIPVIENGKIISMSVINGGEGYNVPPVIEIVGDGQYATAVGVIGINANDYGKIVSVRIMNGGEKYTYANVNSSSQGDTSNTNTNTMTVPTGPMSIDRAFVSGRTLPARTNLPSAPGPSSPTVAPTNVGNTSIVAATFGTPVITSGAITSIPISNGGSGYTVPPIITISGNGSGARAVAVLGTGAQSGTVVRISITNPGTGYTSASTTTAPSLVGVKLGDPVVVDGVIVSVPILDGGAGQDSATIAITDPSAGASGAVLLPVVTDGVVKGIIVSNGGKGYTNPKLTVSNNGVVTGVFGGNSPATNSGTITSTGGGGITRSALFGPILLRNSSIVDVVIKDGGSGYTEPPIINVGNPGGGVGSRKASVIGVLGTGDKAGTVVGVKILDPGTGYLSGGQGNDFAVDLGNAGPGNNTPATANPNSNGECPAGYGIFPVYGPNEITGFGTYRNAVVGNICAKGTVVDTVCGKCRLPEFAMHMINVYCSHLCGGGGGQGPNGGGGGGGFNGAGLGGVLGAGGFGGGQNNNNNLNFGPPPQIPVVIVPDGAGVVKVIPEPPFRYKDCPKQESYHPIRGAKKLVPGEKCQNSNLRRKRITTYIPKYMDYNCELEYKKTDGVYPAFRGYVSRKNPNNPVIIRIKDDKLPNPDTELNEFKYAPRISRFQQITFTYCFTSDINANAFIQNIENETILSEEDQRIGHENEEFLPNVQGDGKGAKTFSNVKGLIGTVVINKNLKYKIEDA